MIDVNNLKCLLDNFFSSTRRSPFKVEGINVTGDFDIFGYDVLLRSNNVL